MTNTMLAINAEAGLLSSYRAVAERVSAKTRGLRRASIYHKARCGSKLARVMTDSRYPLGARGARELEVEAGNRVRHSGPGDESHSCVLSIATSMSIWPFEQVRYDILLRQMIKAL